VMMLLDFVALYGTILMPMGAVIFVDFWLLQKFGMQPDYAANTGVGINWAAGGAWLAALALCLVLNKVLGMQIYFLALPGWLSAGALYLVFSKWYQFRTGRMAIHESVLAIR
jgi:purine-cytosine permease-like protein